MSRTASSGRTSSRTASTSPASRWDCPRLRGGGAAHDQIGKTCHSGCAIQKRMGMCIMPTEGTFARVLRGGTLRPGMPIEAYTAQRVFILCASDKGYAGERNDESTPALRQLVTARGYEVVGTALLPDDRAQLSALMARICDTCAADLLLTTGGTGLSLRDVTPEATADHRGADGPGPCRTDEAAQFLGHGAGLSQPSGLRDARADAHRQSSRQPQGRRGKSPGHSGATAPRPGYSARDPGRMCRGFTYIEKRGEIMKKRFFVCLFVLLSVVAGFAQGSSRQKTELLISAAASLMDCMNELKAVYMAKNPSIIIRCNYGSSGALQQQIEQGAPVDLFFSAGVKQMKALVDKGLMDASTVKDILENHVVSSYQGRDQAFQLRRSGKPSVTKIGIGDPKSVPAVSTRTRCSRTWGSAGQ